MENAPKNSWENKALACPLHRPDSDLLKPEEGSVIFLNEQELRTAQIILCMPKVMQEAGLYVSSAMMNIWLWGKSNDYRVKLSERQPEPRKQKWEIAEISIESFAEKQVLKKRVNDVIELAKEKVGKLKIKDLLNPDKYKNDRLGVNDIVESVRKVKNNGKEVQFGDFDEWYYPGFDIDVVKKMDWVDFTKDIIGSLLDGNWEIVSALGKFSIRAYCKGKVVIRENEIILRIDSVGARIFDHYEFKREDYLGVWDCSKFEPRDQIKWHLAVMADRHIKGIKEALTGKKLITKEVISDEDFQMFSDKYVPLHNAMADQDSSRKKLIERNAKEDSIWIYVPMVSSDLEKPIEIKTGVEIEKENE